MLDAVEPFGYVGFDSWRRMSCLAALLLLPLVARAEEHGHEHHAPHKGALIVLGEEFAHLELLLAADGKLTGYVLDGEAEKAVRVKPEKIELKIDKIGEQPAAMTVTLDTVANVLTGERAGDSSEFSATVDALKGAKTFEGMIVAITVRGKEFRDVKFKFPQGNEH
ncbi:MAG TPA: hypothetical protein VGP72_11525 [Planctomycetota bacterium]|jgi:hypothetical protein